MNELRLKYQFETGHQVRPTVIDTEHNEELGMCIFEDGREITGREQWEVFPVEYVEWLEQQLSDCESVHEINNLIDDRKNKTINFFDPNK